MKAAIIAMLMAFFTVSDNPDEILGKWSTENNEGIVEIYKQDQKYYGKLISLKVPNDPDGQPRTDRKNGNSKLKTRSLIGILVFWGMEYSTKHNRWENGMIYDPNMGHEAKGYITVIDNSTIKLKGYVGFEWISKSQIWKRKKD